MSVRYSSCYGVYGCDETPSTDSTPPRIVGQGRKESRRGGMTLFVLDSAPFFLIRDNSAEHSASRASTKYRGKTGEEQLVWSLRAEDLNVDLVGGSILHKPEWDADAAKRSRCSCLLVFLPSLLDVLAWMAAVAEHKVLRLK
jgi:hypothetical protein